MACRSHDKAANGNGAAGATGDSPSPPAHAAKPARARHDCGQFDIRIGKDGTWYYRGSPIGRKELVCLFASVLKREPNGDYVLETPAERGRIEVEDAPFVAVELFWRECPDPECDTGGTRQCLTFRTNLDEMVTADAEHPIRVAIDPRTREPRPYITVRPGLEARINRAVFYELAALAQTESLDGREVMGVWSEGMFFPIDEAPADAVPTRRARKGRAGELRSAAE
ncbi:MAG: DUF1285 domain-containing protein [Acetobacteraceae bacterium]